MFKRLALFQSLLYLCCVQSVSQNRIFQGTAQDGSILSGIYHSNGQVAIPPTYLHIDPLSGGNFLCELPAGSTLPRTTVAEQGFQRIDYLKLNPGRCTACHLLNTRLRNSGAVYSLVYPVHQGLLVQDQRGMALLDTLLRPLARYPGIMPLSPDGRKGYAFYNGKRYGLLHPDGKVAMPAVLEKLQSALSHYAPTSGQTNIDWLGEDTGQFSLLGNADVQSPLHPEEGSSARWLPAQQNGMQGLISLKTLDWVIPPRYEFIYWMDTLHQFLVVQQPGKISGIGLLNAGDLSVMVPETLAKLSTLTNNLLLAAIQDSSGHYAQGVLSKCCLEWLWQPSAALLRILPRGPYILLQSEEKTGGELWGMADSDNLDLILPIEYTSLSIHDNGLVYVEKGDQRGYFSIEEDGWRLPPVYDDIQELSDYRVMRTTAADYWLVRIGYKYGVYNTRQRHMVLRPEWEQLLPLNATTLLAQQSGQTLLLDLNTGNTQPVPQLDNRWPRSWQTPVGYLSYRGTLATMGDALVVGTHPRYAEHLGVYLNPATAEMGGLRLLNSRTGQVTDSLCILPQDSSSTLPVNGVVVHKDWIYTTADYHGLMGIRVINGRMLIQWQASLPSSAEGSPALADLNGDGHPDVICTMRGKGVVAVHGITGARLWEVALPDEEMAYADGSMGSPAIADLNGDGMPDIVVGAQGRRVQQPDNTWRWEQPADAFLWALNGRDGSPLWQLWLQGQSTIKASPWIIAAPTGTEILAATVGGLFVRAGVDGRLLSTTLLPSELFTTPVPLPGQPDAYAFVSSHSNTRAHTGSYGTFSLYGQITIDTYGRPQRKADIRQAGTGLVTASPLIADVLGTGTAQLVYIQEEGLLHILSPEGKPLETLGLAIGAEATPLLTDMDGDSRPEVYLLSKDGVLSCYRPHSSSQGLWRGTFRGDAGNCGRQELK
ncbi:MAG: VCBS repeat-containing protein [Bacteroidetes bacterium]|nr:VCBS repeat-containing protein [Bacteroidota bacterium]